MKRYKEKEMKKYIIADLSQPTNYLYSIGGGRYNFIDNIVALLVDAFLIKSTKILSFFISFTTT